MKWYQIKEQAAGEKRLMTLWYLYRFCGKRTVQFLTIFISFFAFCSSQQIRKYTKKNLSIIYEYTKNYNSKPNIYNQYKLVLNYALSLVDKMEVFSNQFDEKKLIYKTISARDQMDNDITNKKGIFFICNHIGNVEILRKFVQKPRNIENPHVNVFLSENQCKIFNGFLKRIQAKTDISTYPVENINVNTAIEIKDKLDNGEIVIMAGDRTSAASNNSSIEIEFLNKKIELPLGTFKFAQMMESSIYFISAIKSKNDCYDIYLEKFEPKEKLNKTKLLEFLIEEYKIFLEKMVKIAPHQFYHFYDVFKN